MKPALFITLSFLSLCAYSAYAQKKNITLTEAFRDVAANVKKTIAPKARPVSSVSLSKDYNIYNYSLIASGRLDEEFDGALKNKGQKFLAEARKNGVCPIFLAAIAMHESANGKSEFARERNNVFGIFLKGKYHRFESVDECIEFSAKLLAGRIYSKNPTVVGVQRIYCPVGAKNDPKGLNRYWLNGVLDKMQKLWGKTIYVAEEEPVFETFDVALNELP